MMPGMASDSMGYVRYPLVLQCLGILLLGSTVDLCENRSHSLPRILQAAQITQVIYTQMCCQNCT